jgi:phage terminase Nu1 subunit (DNA packaging protein)
MDTGQGSNRPGQGLVRVEPEAQVPAGTEAVRVVRVVRVESEVAPTAPVSPLAAAAAPASAAGAARPGDSETFYPDHPDHPDQTNTDKGLARSGYADPTLTTATSTLTTRLPAGHLTRAALAERLGVHPRTLNKWRALGAPTEYIEAAWRAWLVHCPDQRLRLWALTHCGQPRPTPAQIAAEALPDDDTDDDDTDSVAVGSGLDDPTSWAEEVAKRRAEAAANQAALAALNLRQRRREVVEVAAVRVAFRAALATLNAALLDRPGHVARALPELDPALRARLRKAIDDDSARIRDAYLTSLRSALRGLTQDTP